MISQFYAIFNQEATFKIKAPGRINLIGEHIDYNDGFVLPAAINRYINFEIATNNLNKYRFYAKNFEEKFEWNITESLPKRSTWTDYLFGVIEQFRKQNYTLGGFDVLFWGDIPAGAGLSSSAALECGLAIGLNQLFGFEINKIELVKMCQAAENQFVGINCGIMDQFASIMGQASQVMLLDCQNLNYSYYPFSQKEYKIVLFDTAVKHNLGTSEYNTRRAECQQALAILKVHYPSINTYRDVTQTQIEAVKHCFTDNIYRRASFVIAEIARINEACILLQNNDLKAFGLLMNATHWGLSQQYEVSCVELDFLAQKAQKNPNVLGSRMMGGGFGGCTINLVHHLAVNSLINEMKNDYLKQFNLKLDCHLVEIVDGVKVVQ